jgi:hypothetical protein
MSTLLRLKGDSSVNSREIKNSFKQPVIIPANSSVGLKYLDATIAPDSGQDMYFTKATDSADLTVDIGIAGGSTINIPFDPLQFSTPEALVSYFVGVLNSQTHSLAGDNFIYFDWDIVEGKFLLTMHSSSDSIEYVDFTDTIWTYYGFQRPAATTSDITFDGNVDCTVMLSGAYMPVNGSVEFISNTRFIYSVQIYSYGVSTPIHNFEIQANSGNYFVNGSNQSDVGTVASANNDIISIIYDASQVVVTVKDSTGAVKGTFTKNIMLPVGRQAYEIGKLTLRLVTPANVTAGPTVNSAVLSDFAASYIIPGSTFNNFPGSFTISFDSEDFSRRLGFRDETIQSSGDPAQVLSSGIVPRYDDIGSGVILAINNLVLDTFDGSRTGGQPVNILDIFRTSAQYEIYRDVPEITYLKLNNRHDISLNQLSLSFYNDADGVVVPYVGYPTVALVIRQEK